MGKVKGKKVGKHLSRHNPLGIPSNQTLSLAEGEEPAAESLPDRTPAAYLSSILEQVPDLDLGLDLASFSLPTVNHE